MKEQLSRPAVCDLTFQVFDRAVHPELIDSRMVRSFDQDGYRLTLHWTPSGHFLVWEGREMTLVEVLTDQSDPLPENHQLFAHRVGGERSECHFPHSKVSYQTCFQAETMPPEVFCHLHDELRDDGEKSGMFHMLRSEDRLGLAPISVADLQSRKGSLIVHTYHTFPDEFTVVKSQTLIEVDLK